MHVLTPLGWHLKQGAKANLGEWVELSNGCMCCSVKSEFVQAIETLMTKRENFDHILIETTGEKGIIPKPLGEP